MQTGKEMLQPSYAEFLEVLPGMIADPYMAADCYHSRINRKPF